MNDRAVSLLEQYEIEIVGTRKGRGAILCDTDKGCLIFKEYEGKEERLVLQNRFLNFLKEDQTIGAETILPTAEGELFVKDTDGTKYFLKTYCEGRECNIHDSPECGLALKTLAVLHEKLAQFSGSDEACDSDREDCRKEINEFEKKNRELKKVRRFLQRKSQKNRFEINLLGCYDLFLQQAYDISEVWTECLKKTLHTGEINTCKGICHGDYQYHNLLWNNGEWFIINFEKYAIDSPVRDLHLLLRKLLEKNNWSRHLGSELLKSYESQRELTLLEKKDLYCRLAYPEKFWKIVNFYYNSGKAWIPERNQEKLDKLLSQEREKQIFLQYLWDAI